MVVLVLHGAIVHIFDYCTSDSKCTHAFIDSCTPLLVLLICNVALHLDSGTRLFVRLQRSRPEAVLAESAMLQICGVRKRFHNNSG